MIALYIAAGILVFFFVLLIIPAGAEVKIDDDAQVTIRYAFLKFKVLPSEKERADQAKTPEGAGRDKEKQKEGTVRRMIREKGVAATVNEIISLVKRALKGVARLLRHIRIRKFRLAVTVATEDAATTGIEYGAVCAVLYPALGLLGSLCDLGQAEYGVNADFDAKESSIGFDGAFSVLPLFVLTAGVYVAAGYIKMKLSNNKTVKK